jgi:energy-coupling factor transport system permease protein
MDLLRSLPIGLYLEKPITWLHSIDPRVKLGWLMTFLAAPLLGNAWWRLAIVAFLMLISLSTGIPWRVWKQQMGWLLLLSLLVFVITCLSPDGMGIDSQPRLPAGESFPQPTDYNFVVWKSEYNFFGQKSLMITRRGLDLAVRVSTLVFTLIYSTNLYLLTTAPEEITAGLERLMHPLRRLRFPVTEVALTLTLSLRFIPLVLEEIQNLARSLRTRAINWKKLGIKQTAKIWLLVVERLLDNLLLRAEQIAVAMDIRGFTSPNEHQVQWNQLSLKWKDWLILVLLIPFWLLRFQFGGMD